MDTVLRVEGLAKRFPRFALEGVSFSLERGTVMGFIGQNGAGKTTTIKCVMDLLRRDGGVVEVFGMDPRTHGASVRERIGFVYDELNVPGMLTGEDVRGFVSRLYRGWDEAAFRARAREFDLDLGQRVDKLSKGQKVKLSLALALCHNAELIIMDEPTSGLDPVFRAELLDLLYGIIQDERMSIFFSTHITSDLEKIADSITFIDGGRLVLSDAKDAVMDRFKIVRGPAGRLTPRAAELCVGARSTAVGFEALTERPSEVAALLDGTAVIERASLEDIMVHTVRRSANA
jgi:ABC-2 type transport system ATP-binding protein